MVKVTGAENIVPTPGIKKFLMDDFLSILTTVLKEGGKVIPMSHPSHDCGMSGRVTNLGNTNKLIVENLHVPGTPKLPQD